MDSYGKENKENAREISGEDNGEVVTGRIRKNATEELVVSRRTFKGHDVISLRVFANGFPLANKGLTAGVGMWPEVLVAIQRALTAYDGGSQ